MGEGKPDACQYLEMPDVLETVLFEKEGYSLRARVMVVHGEGRRKGENQEVSHAAATFDLIVIRTLTFRTYLPC